MNSGIKLTDFRARKYYEPLCEKDNVFELLYPLMWIVSILCMFFQLLRYCYDENVLNDDIMFVQFACKNMLICLSASIFAFVPIISFFHWRIKIWFENDAQFWIPFLSIQLPTAFIIQTLVLQNIIDSLNVGAVGRIIVSMEQVRQAMKMISVMVHCYQIKYKNSKKLGSGKKDFFEFPSSMNLIFFFFAPTLIYRDEYPRNQSISMKNIIFYSGFFLITLYQFFLVMKYCIADWYEDIRNETMTVNWMLQQVFHGMFTASAFLFAAQSMFWHAYLNLAAEITRFSDLRFHTDWWNYNMGTKLSRSWNTLVSNFIKECLYNPTYEYTGNKTAGRHLAFFMSGLFHDYVFSWPLGITIYWKCWFPMFLSWPLFIEFVEPRIEHSSSKSIILLRAYLTYPIAVFYAIHMTCIEYYSKARQ